MLLNHLFKKCSLLFLGSWKRQTIPPVLWKGKGERRSTVPNAYCEQKYSHLQRRLSQVSSYAPPPESAVDPQAVQVQHASPHLRLGVVLEQDVRTSESVLHIKDRGVVETMTQTELLQVQGRNIPGIHVNLGNVNKLSKGKIRYIVSASTKDKKCSTNWRRRFFAVLCFTDDLSCNPQVSSPTTFPDEDASLATTTMTDFRTASFALPSMPGSEDRIPFDLLMAASFFFGGGETSSFFVFNLHWSSVSPGKKCVSQNSAASSTSAGSNIPYNIPSWKNKNRRCSMTWGGDEIIVTMLSGISPYFVRDRLTTQSWVLESGR